MGIPGNLVSHGRNRKTGGRLQSIWNRLIWTQQTNREVISMGKWTHKPIDCGHLPSWTWTNHSEKREWWKTRTARWSGWAGGRTRRTGGGGGRPGRRRPAGEQPSQQSQLQWIFEFIITITVPRKGREVEKNVSSSSNDSHGVSFGKNLFNLCSFSKTKSCNKSCQPLLLDSRFWFQHNKTFEATGWVLSSFAFSANRMEFRMWLKHRRHI